MQKSPFLYFSVFNFETSPDLPLEIPTELTTLLKKQGVDTNSSMAFLMDISELGIGNTATLKKLLK